MSDEINADPAEAAALRESHDQVREGRIVSQEELEERYRRQDEEERQ